MSKDINNLKEIANSILEDIQVTKDLKLSTLEKCKNQKKYNLKPFFVTAASIAVIIFSIVSYKFIFHKPDSSLTYNKETPNKSAKLDNEDNKYSNNKKDIASNSSGKTDLKKQTQKNIEPIAKDVRNSSAASVSSSNNNSTSIISNNDKSKENSVNSSLPENKPKISSSENVGLNNNADNINNTSISEKAPQSDSSKSTIASDTPILRSTLSDSSKSISIVDAESFWGGKLLMPSYIPDGFELTDISLPKNDSKEIYVKLNYSFKNIYFKILENKNTTFTSYTGKVININGSNAYITKSKDKSNSSIITTEIDFVKNNIQYSITGNIQEDELIKISKSMN